MKKRKNFLSKIIILPTLCFTLLAASSINVMAESELTPYPDTFIYGDINSDAEVDSADFTMMRSILLGIRSKPATADLNLDGEVDSADFTILRKYLIGQIAYLPYTYSSNGFYIPSYKQPQGSNWCWAATSQSIIAYYKGVQNTPSIEDVVRKVIPIPYNVPISSCLSYGALTERDLSSLTSFGISAKSDSEISSGLNYSALKAEIDAKRPVKAAWKLDYISAAHDVVICGYAEGSSKNVIMFMDPMYGRIYGMKEESFYSIWRNGKIYDIKPL